MKRAIKLKKEINLKNDVTASNKLLRRTSSRADRNTTRTYLKLQETNETAFLDYHDVHEKVRVLQNRVSTHVLDHSEFGIISG